MSYFHLGNNSAAVDTLDLVNKSNPLRNNNLGVVFRRLGQYENAIQAFDYNKSGLNGHKTLGSLQTYMFFICDPMLALEYAKGMVDLPNKYKGILNSINGILSMSLSEIGMYKKYITEAIYCGAIYETASFLKKLVEKFPNSVYLKTRLARLLCHKQIGQYQLGYQYFEEILQMLQDDTKAKLNLQEVIIYYLTNLLAYSKFDKIEYILNSHKLLKNADYFNFIAHYQFIKNHDINSAAVNYEQAILISGSKEKHNCCENLLRFISRRKEDTYDYYYKKYEMYL
jgi:tetratricopeptide (TPR) repeat protein